MRNKNTTLTHTHMQNTHIELLFADFENTPFICPPLSFSLSLSLCLFARLSVSICWVSSFIYLCDHWIYLHIQKQYILFVVAVIMQRNGWPLFSIYCNVQCAAVEISRRTYVCSFIVNNEWPLVILFNVFCEHFRTTLNIIDRNWCFNAGQHNWTVERTWSNKQAHGKLENTNRMTMLWTNWFSFDRYDARWLRIAAKVR